MISNSLALLTDAVDLLKDIAEFGINIVCINYAKRKSSDQHTFGFLKAESLGAFVSIILIWVFYSLLLVESINVIIAGGREVESGIMLYISCIALLLNIIKTCILASDEIGGGGDDDKEAKLPEMSEEEDSQEDSEN
jgi:cation diffusion facilitator family transporter